MALPAVGGAVISASDLYGIGQPSGGIEHGKYYLQGAVYATGGQLSAYYRSSSQGSTPVSVGRDMADFADFNVNDPSVQIQTSFGFSMHTTSTTANIECHVGGNYTIQY